MKYQSVRLAKQEVPLHKHSDHERNTLNSSKSDQKSCDLSAGCGTPIFLAHQLSSFAFSCTTQSNKLAFKLLLLRCFFVHVFLLRWKNLDGSNPILDALKSTPLSRHTCHRSGSTTRILTAHFSTRELSPLLLKFSFLVYFLLKSNDHVWSFCGHTQSYSFEALEQIQHANQNLDCNHVCFVGPDNTRMTMSLQMPASHFPTLLTTSRVSR